MTCLDRSIGRNPAEGIASPGIPCFKADGQLAEGEAIQICDDFTIIIVDTTNNRAKMAIWAPNAVKILRTGIEERDEGRPGKTRRVVREHQGKGCQERLSSAMAPPKRSDGDLLCVYCGGLSN